MEFHYQIVPDLDLSLNEMKCLKMLLTLNKVGFKTLDPNTDGLHMIRNAHSDRDLAIQKIM